MDGVGHGTEVARLASKATQPIVSRGNLATHLMPDRTRSAAPWIRAPPDRMSASEGEGDHGKVDVASEVARIFTSNKFQMRTRGRRGSKIRNGSSGRSFVLHYARRDTCETLILRLASRNGQTGQVYLLPLRGTPISRASCLHLRCWIHGQTRGVPGSREF